MCIQFNVAAGGEVKVTLFGAKEQRMASGPKDIHSLGFLQTSRDPPFHNWNIQDTGVISCAKEESVRGFISEAG